MREERLYKSLYVNIYSSFVVNLQELEATRHEQTGAYSLMDCSPARGRKKLLITPCHGWLICVMLSERGLPWWLRQ